MALKKTIDLWADNWQSIELEDRLHDRAALSDRVLKDPTYTSSCPQKIRDYVTIKDYGGRYKITYVKHFTPIVGYEDAADRVDAYTSDVRDDLDDARADVRADNSLRRTKSTVRELALCNPWDYFCTLTLDAQKYDRHNLTAYRKDFAQYVRNQRRLHGGDIRYLLIPEQHKDGAWHMHGLFSGIPAELLREFSVSDPIPKRLKDTIRGGERLFDWTGYAQKFGWVSLSPVRDHLKVSSYITKYITKDMQARNNEVGAHLYFATHGLRRAELVHRGFVDNAHAIKWDFENEFCKIMWSDSEDFQNLHFV